MERVPSGTKEQERAEAFLLRASEDLKTAKEKLSQMDGDKEFGKEEYRKIQEQAKRAAFLEKMSEAAVFYAEAAENNNDELLEIMKKYLNL